MRVSEVYCCCLIAIVKFWTGGQKYFNIINNDDSLYRGEINILAGLCTENNPPLNVSRTTELIVDFRGKEATTHTPVYISGGGADEQFLNINIPEKLH